MKNILTLFAMVALGLGTAFGQAPPPGGGATVDYQLTFTSGTYDSEVSYELVPTAGGAAIRSVTCGNFDASLVDTVTLNAGTSYDFNAYDDYGDGWNFATYTITRLPCGNVVNSESPNNDTNGDGSFACDENDLESTFTFTAAVCPTCPNPTDFVGTASGTDSAIVSWVGSADFYGFEYGPTGFTPNVGQGIQVAPAISPTVITGLTPGTIYDVYIQAACGLPIPSDFSEIQMTSFVTGIANETCETAITIAVADDTTIVMGGSTLDGPTPSCSFGIMDDDAWLKFMGTGAPVLIYGSVQGEAADFAMEIWDGCPSDTSSSVIACDDDGNDAPSGLMPLDQICTVAGQMYYIRVWEYNDSEPGMYMGLTVKEVRPTITGNSNVGQHGMTINFTGYTGGEAQVIRYHEFGNSPNFSWKNLPASAQSGYINNLEPNTRYTVRVGTRCPGQPAAYSDTATFWTRSMPCPAPMAVGDTVSGYTSAYVYWVGSADYYKIRYRAVGDTNWIWWNTTEIWNELTGLMPGTTYEWQVRAICNDGGNKPYGPLQTFTTYAEGRLASVDGFNVTAFNLYPNPTNGSVTVEFNSEVAENITFNVTDLSGKLVMSNTIPANEGANRVFMEMGDVEAGVYLTTLSNQNGISERVRVIVK